MVVCNFYSGDMMEMLSFVMILDDCVWYILPFNKVWNNPSHFFFSLVFFAVNAIQYSNIMQYDFFSAVKCNLMELANDSGSSCLGQ